MAASGKVASGRLQSPGPGLGHPQARDLLHIDGPASPRARQGRPIPSPGPRARRRGGGGGDARGRVDRPATGRQRSVPQRGPHLSRLPVAGLRGPRRARRVPPRTYDRPDRRGLSDPCQVRRLSPRGPLPGMGFAGRRRHGRRWRVDQWRAQPLRVALPGSARVVHAGGDQAAADGHSHHFHLPLLPPHRHATRTRSVRGDGVRRLRLPRDVDQLATAGDRRARSPSCSGRRSAACSVRPPARPFQLRSPSHRCSSVGSQRSWDMPSMSSRPTSLSV